MTDVGQQLHQTSIANKQAFWQQAAKALDWVTPSKQILDESEAPFYHWFSDGELNTCYNAIDRHVLAGRGEQIAIHYVSPVTETEYSITYHELQAQVARLAGYLRTMGVTKGDRVVIYMPMVPETAYAMLACARIGAIHSVVFGGFAANELATRINDAKPKLVMSASCGIEPSGVVPYKPLLDKALNEAVHKVEHCLILNRPQYEAQMQTGRDADWQTALKGCESVDCVTVNATDPLYVLYTSGTTGQPKGVVRDNGGHAVALAWSMANIYDIHQGDVFWAASDVGWVVGHSYIVYGPLLVGATTLLYEGKPVGTPDPGAFWRTIAKYQVKSFFTAPTAIRAIKREDPNGEFIQGVDLSCLKNVFLAGERCDPDTLHWAEDKLHKPVIDHWWQTETGWPVAANLMGVAPIAVKAGSPGRPVPGYEVDVVDELGAKVAANVSGNVVIKLPLPPGTLTTLWQNNKRYQDSYLSMYPGYYLTGDAGYMDEEGYLYIMSRIDDIINVAGHRLSTGRFEEVLCQHPDVAEAAVIGVDDKLKGQVPLGLVVLKKGVTITDEELHKQLIALVRQEIGPVASFRLVSAIQKLPKTRSGKILRGTMRKIADNQQYTAPATIEDPQTLDLVRTTLTRMGYADALVG
ncbi:propionyl-CoA synthetase [Shewanella xiamenensis]|uniref:Propionyl-CoA synthetase n=1 Tax=Shewanella xiamenensis TaxID=332186 RepID=A0ABT6UAG5_9GAMM|nr:MULTISPECIES: propionyl-CoA synthetase [Shewanella]MCT8858536.1 propionyl-CoA synthetase [Shewanella xiamenensis]MDH1627055.1 propionyl-CoA synthetase [Shewanella xiamenensis]MDI5831463.1 propionyl-CoA synthetase [Shewanella xiamenensis]MDV5249010.1 propionyl-CoA synthetase [Shewanella xiamenensis]PWH01488.1 propionyl-CoA synthetase [Shewanella xiamenensis]